MYVLKAQPEDFIVEEVLSLKTFEEGKYVYFSLKKRQYNTLDALRTVAHALHIPVKTLGFAGNKDRQAITTQYCSAPQQCVQQLEGLSLKDIDVEVIGFGNEPLFLGRNDGNRFRIVVRKIMKAPNVPKQFINYFGEQRFGKNNIAVGRLLIQKKFGEAVNILLQDTGHLAHQLQRLQEKYPNNPVNQLRELPGRMLKFYAHAYQSHLWNMWVHRHKALPEELLLPGFNMETDEVLDTILQEEEVTQRDFIIRQLPGLSVTPLKRATQVTPKEMEIGALEDDELHAGFKKCVVSFLLPKGSYATVIIEQIFGQQSSDQPQ